MYLFFLFVLSEAEAKAKADAEAEAKADAEEEEWETVYGMTSLKDWAGRAYSPYVRLGFLCFF